MLAVLWSLALAVNPHLDEGRRLYEQLEYEKAEPVLRLAVGAPTSNVDERREAFDLLARTLAAMGRHSEAEAVYGELLSTDASAPPPESASPRIRALFRDAKTKLYPPGFVKLRRAPSPPGHLAVEVIDPWSAVRKVTLEVAGREDAPLAMTGQGGTYSAAQDERAPVHVAKALDADGRPLAELQLVTAVTADGTPVVEGGGSGARWLGWGGFGAASVASAAVAVAMAVLAVDAHDAAGRARFYDQVRALDDLARRRAVAGWICGGVAVALGVTAVVFAIRF